MRLIKLAIANVSPIVGAVTSNMDRMLEQARLIARADVTLAGFPEQATGGYPPEDLVQWRAFVAAQRAEIERFAAETARAPTVFVIGTTVQIGGQLFNAAAVVHAGRVLGFVPKEKLPTYNVFYEARIFSRGSPGVELDAGGVPLGDLLFRFGFGTVAVEVCEDAWSPDGPMRRRCYAGAELVVNVSSSPYRVGVVSTRREMLATRSADNQATLMYVNAVGGQDGLVYDGGGFVFQNGRLLLEAPRFREGYSTCVVDLDRTIRSRVENTTWRSECEAFQRSGCRVRLIPDEEPTVAGSTFSYPAPIGGSFFLPPAEPPGASPRDQVLDELFDALSLGLKDYFVKSRAFRLFGLALSGGRDSMLSLLVTWRAVQLLHPGASDEELREAVGASIAAFYMPTRYSGEGTWSAARTLCRELGVPLTILSIDEAFDREAEAARVMLGGAEPSRLTLQNIQARLRGSRMWNWANSAGGLFVQTGDMSEKAVGYTTLGGDLEGSLSVIANVPKTVVIALLERVHARFGFEGIRLTLQTAPGPELDHAQEAESELMPFRILDACLHLYAGEKLSPAEVAQALPSLFPEVASGELERSARRFAEMFSRSIFKWVQSPLALHVGSLDLDRERALQLPVVQKNEW
ncbi:MAG: NAD(+) synthase [Acidobacteria bacterium]|nr:NAD(+) synthase [Acidobacteriota bacterium]